MEAVLDTIRRAFETDVAPAEAPVVTEAGERHVAQASHDLVQRAEAVRRRKQADEDTRRLEDPTGAAAQSMLRAQRARVAPSMDDAERDRFIDKEMNTRLSSTPWYRLDACFRWQKIQDYVASLHRSDIDRDQLLSQLRPLVAKLNKVAYDRDTQSIVRLNHSGI